MNTLTATASVDKATSSSNGAIHTRPAVEAALKLPVGSLDNIDEDFYLRGWAWREATPNVPATIKIMIDHDLAAHIKPQDFRADLVAEGIGHGCFAFSWRIPDLYFDGKPHEISTFHCDYDMELPGSPKTTELPARGRLATAQAASPFINPGLTQWPDGLRGALTTRLQEIAPGLKVVLDDNAGAGSFAVDEPRQTRSHDAAFYGVRIEVEQASRIWLHHRIGIIEHQRLDRSMEFTIELALAEADEPLAQRPAEIWLTRETKGGFDTLRRLGRGRIFRKTTLLSFSLRLNADEITLAKKRILYLGVMMDRCRAIRMHPAQLVRLPGPAQPGFVSFKDFRLAEAFNKVRELAKINGEASLYGALLREGANASRGSIERDDRAVGAKSLLPARYPFTQIIIPVFNGDKLVADCIKSVLAQTTTPFQIILINDGSRGLTTTFLEGLVQSDQRIVLLDPEKNRGYTKSINEAIKIASADWLVILNSDTIVSTHWLAKLHDAAIATEKIGMVGPLSNAASWQSIPFVKTPDDSWSKNDFIRARDVAAVQARLDELTERAYPAAPMLNGFCTLINRRVFDEIGLFDEDAFPIGYGEETDLCLRAIKAGFALVIADDCFVFHHKSISFGVEGRKPLSRAGAHELMNKHLGVKIVTLEQELRANPVLARLRQRMSDLPQRLR